MKIKAIVKFNEGEAFVLEDIDKLKYRKIKNDTIIGTNGLIYSFYGFESPSKNFEAFAGRKFNIELEDGTIEKCFGQWWDRITQNALNTIGDDIVKITASSYDELKDCYVFTGYYGLRKQIEEFRKTYTGKVYEYWEYKKIINN